MNNNTIKMIFLGDMDVGKSCLIESFAKDNFPNEIKNTITTNFYVKNICSSGVNYQLKIFDTAGQERFRSFTKQFYKGSDLAILVYDITSEQTFNDVEDYWASEVKDMIKEDCHVLLVGNKNDLDQQRKVSWERGSELAQKNLWMFAESSARNVDQLRQLLLNTVTIVIRAKIQNDLNKNQIVPVNNNQQIINIQNEKKKSCCF